MWNTATVRAIAREAGVSERSVRRLYWGERPQRAETRARILMVCRKHGVEVPTRDGDLQVPNVTLYAVPTKGTP